VAVVMNPSCWLLADSEPRQHQQWQAVRGSRCLQPEAAAVKLSGWLPAESELRPQASSLGSEGGKED